MPLWVKVSGDAVVTDYSVTDLTPILNLNFIPNIAISDFNVLANQTLLADSRVFDLRVCANF